MARDRIFIVISSVAYESESIGYVGLNWEAMSAFVSTQDWSGGDELRIEIWDLFTNNRKPVEVLHPEKVERYLVPEEPDSDG